MKCLYFVYAVLALALTNFSNAEKIRKCTESKTIALTVSILCMNIYNSITFIIFILKNNIYQY